MPWKVSDAVSERMSFVGRLEQGEPMAALCREYGVSRTTGYRLLERFRKEGSKGLFDRPRAPLTQPHRTPEAIVELLCRARQRHPTWGAKKLRAWLLGKEPGLVLPAPSTIAEHLKRAGLVEPRKRRRRTVPYEAPLTRATAPNEVWCADFKGEFRLGNGKLCYPLTITDRYSRMLLCCEGLESTRVETALLVFERAFKEHGLPRVIRTDNGVPFAARGRLGLSQLSVRWLRLGIWPERIQLAHPEQNGQHERMHLVLKQETTRPAAPTLLAQQERFDRFLDEYNQERPHEALGLVTPSSVHRSAERRHPDTLPELDYPLDDETRTVYRDGSLRLPGARATVFVSAALRGERVGLRELPDGRWRLAYAGHELGVIDPRERYFEPSATLFTVGPEPAD